MKSKLETTKGAKEITADEYKTLIGNPRKFLSSSFGAEERAILWSDLNEVGTTKAVGQLPLDTLVYALDVTDLKVLTKSYIEKGLKAKIYFDRNPGPGSTQAIGFLQVWDEAMLQKLLNANAKVLREAKWPQNASAFVDKMSSTTAPKGELYDLIARAFNDPRYRNKGV